MEKPRNCEARRYYNICRLHYGGPGCEYSEEEMRKHGEDNNS